MKKHSEVASVLAGAALSAGLLLAEHIALWPYRDEISKPEAYVIGGATLGAGAVVTSALLDDWRPALVSWAGLIAGGLVVGGAYGVRGLLKTTDANRARARLLQKRIERRLNGIPTRADFRRN
jgi:hypothetical protein